MSFPLVSLIHVCIINFSLFMIYLMMLSILHIMQAYVVNNELRRILKEASVSQFEERSWHQPGGTEVNHTEPQNSYSLVWYLNLGPTVYKAGLLGTRLQHLVSNFDEMLSQIIQATRLYWHYLLSTYISSVYTYVCKLTYTD